MQLTARGIAHRSEQLISFTLSRTSTVWIIEQLVITSEDSLHTDSWSPILRTGWKGVNYMHTIKLCQRKNLATEALAGRYSDRQNRQSTWRDRHRFEDLNHCQKNIDEGNYTSRSHEYHAVEWVRI